MRSLYSLGSIEDKCEQWGAWARGNGLGAASLRTGSGVTPDITDEEGSEFDQLMTRVSRYDWLLYDLMLRHYVHREGFGELGVSYECSVSTVRAHHSKALSFLAGMIELKASGASLGDWRSGLKSVAIPKPVNVKTRRVRCQIAASDTAKKKADKTAKTVRWAIDYLADHGEKVSKVRVAQMAGISREQVSRRYSDMF